MTRTVQISLPAPMTPRTPGFSSAGARSRAGFDLDPFLNLDLFRMDRPTFPPHPHAGFSAVTLLLPDSPGSFRNRDSRGYDGPILPGGLHWTQAGSGILHEEVPTQPGIPGVGFQIFVDLPASHKLHPPAVFHVEPHEITSWQAEGVSATIYAGDPWGVRGPLPDMPTAVTLVLIDGKPGSQVVLPTLEGQRAFLFAIAGKASVGGTDVGEGRVSLFTDAGDPPTLIVGSTGFRALFAMGPPLHQPVVWGGPFAMTSEAEIRAAYARYQRGDMGTLAPSA
jgi:hypothetical protein